jgi:hypothetical protein
VSRATARRQRRARGQGLVEFALVLPVFLLILFGVIDGGRFVYMSSTLSQAAREGARLGAVEAGWMGSSDPGCGQLGGPVCPANLAALRADVLTAANRMMSPFGTITSAELFTSCDAQGSAPSSSNWSAQTCVNNAPNNVISVRVEMTFVPITPVLGQMLAVTVSGSSTMVIN